MSRTDKEIARAVAQELRNQARQASWATDPVGWARDVLGVHMWSKQKEISSSVVDHKRTVVASCHGTGKVVCTNEMIPVPLETHPSGWMRAGDLAIGMDVLGSAGNPVRITARTGIQYVPYYRVHFDDGTSVVAGGPHEWSAIDLRSRPRHVSDWRKHWDHARIVTTDFMRENLETGGQKRWRIPLAAPLDLPEADLPVHPYVLGLWLGDGLTGQTDIAIGSSKLAIGPELERLGYRHHIAPVNDGRDLFMVRLGGPKGMGTNVFRTLLREVGVLDEKHVPASYLRASAEQRWALLQGLMDSDGFLNERDGTCGIDLTSEYLAAGVRELIVSLGMKCFLRVDPAGYTLEGVHVRTGLRYRHTFRPPHRPFRVRGENWQAPGSQASRHTQRTIVSITEEPDAVPGFCIEVDAPDHLYLCGRSMVPTHNSMIASVLVCWWISTKPLGEAIAVSSAPTYAQVNKILWEEIRKHHATAKRRGTPMAGYVTQGDEWKTADGQILAFGRKPATGDRHGFQGIHRKYVLAIGDEACGLPEEIWTGIEAITTGDSCRMLYIGNPDDRVTEFGKAFLDSKAAGDWNRISVPATSTPNFTGEEVPPLLNEVLVSAAWAEERRRNWGEDDPRYISKVLARFPEQSKSSLFPPALIATSMDEVPAQPVGPVVRLGVDVARFGTDANVVVSHAGVTARVEDTWSGTDTVSSAHKVLMIAEELKNRLKASWVEIRVDAVGLGAGVVDTLNARSVLVPEPWFSVYEMHGSASPPVDVGGSVHGYGNARAYWFDQLRQQMVNGRVRIEGGIHDQQIRDDLGIVFYDFRVGKLFIISKEQMRKDHGRSPDFADALAYATAPVAEGLPVGTTVSDTASAVSEDLEDMMDLSEMSIAPY